MVLVMFYSFDFPYEILFNEVTAGKLRKFIKNLRIFNIIKSLTFLTATIPIDILQQPRHGRHVSVSTTVLDLFEMHRSTAQHHTCSALYTQTHNIELYNCRHKNKTSHLHTTVMEPSFGLRLPWTFKFECLKQAL